MDSVKFPTPGAKSGVKSLGKSPMLPGRGGGVGQHIDRCIRLQTRRDKQRQRRLQENSERAETTTLGQA